MSDRKFDLSRRKALLGLGTIGVASAGAGIGTSAYFNDNEGFSGSSLTAGSLNLAVDYYTSIDQGQYGSSEDEGTIDGEEPSYTYEFNDVKPGDSGSLEFCPIITGNPAWVFVDGSGTDYENGQTQPESEVDNASGGELSEAIEVTVTLKDADYERELTAYDTLADLLADLENGGLQLDGDLETDDETEAYYPDQYQPCIHITWTIPETVGNEIQTDSVEFDLSFDAVQERYNPEANRTATNSTP